MCEAGLSTGSRRCNVLRSYRGSLACDSVVHPLCLPLPCCLLQAELAEMEERLQEALATQTHFETFHNEFAMQVRRARACGGAAGAGRYGRASCGRWRAETQQGQQE